MASSIMNTKARDELEYLLIAIEANNEALSAARAEGDLRENAAYQIASENAVQYALRQQELENIISEPIEIPSTSIIELGSLIEVLYLGSCTAEGELEQIATGEVPSLYLFEKTGDTVLQGVLGADSPLGQEIQNNQPGDFMIQCEFTFEKYRVAICPDKEAEYLAEYPSSFEERLKIIHARKMGDTSA